MYMLCSQVYLENVIYIINLLYPLPSRGISENGGAGEGGKELTTLQKYLLLCLL
jgi:hypothetical protein